VTRVEAVLELIADTRRGRGNRWQYQRIRKALHVIGLAGVDALRVMRALDYADAEYKMRSDYVGERRP
jgi:hypothetical protein